MSAVQLRYLLPLSLFFVLAVGLAVGLTRDPSQIPSVLIDQQAPRFSLGPVEGRERGLTSADLEGEVRLVNFFASWCFPCRLEHPLLNRLTEDGTVPVFGINYKDKPEDARRWLDRMGDPYVRSGADHDGVTVHRDGVAKELTGCGIIGDELRRFGLGDSRVPLGERQCAA